MPDTDVAAQGWTDIVLSTHKRARSAFFLSLVASCVVLITVFNLSLSREQGVPPLNASGALNIQEVTKEHIKHQVDRSYYELPLLGIQITCDDAAFFGPLTLLVFSFYSLIAFRALHRQITCLVQCRLERGSLIQELLETELLPWVSHPQDKRQYLCTTSRLMSILLFLPSIACLFVLVYGTYGYFAPPYYDSHPLYQLMSRRQMIEAVTFDCIGALFTLLVFVYNYHTFQFSTVKFSTQSGMSTTSSAQAAATVGGLKA